MSHDVHILLLTLTLFIVGGWHGFSCVVRERVVTPLQTLSNLLAALREGDYSIRARGASTKEPLGQVMLEANVLGETLHDQRLGALEATNLVRTVISGSGIGRVLSPQIAEAHGGTLELETRNDRPGCMARLELPIRT